jgi:hypothetical protein
MHLELLPEAAASAIAPWRRSAEKLSQVEVRRILPVIETAYQLTAREIETASLSECLRRFARQTVQKPVLRRVLRHWLLVNSQNQIHVHRVSIVSATELFKVLKIKNDDRLQLNMPDRELLLLLEPKQNSLVQSVTITTMMKPGSN